MAASHMFVVHGKACEKRPEARTCSHARHGADPVGKMYIVDFRPLMGTDWRARGPGPSPSSARGLLLRMPARMARRRFGRPDVHCGLLAARGRRRPGAVPELRQHCRVSRL
jgi:hypothetical protein